MCESNTSVDCRGTRIVPRNSVFRDGRSPFLRTAILLVLIGVWGVFSSPSARAEMIAVTITGVGNGTLVSGNVSTTIPDNTPFVWTLTYDPSSYGLLDGDSGQPIFYLTPGASVITLGGAPGGDSTRLIVTKEHGLWVNNDPSNLCLAPIEMSGDIAGSNILKVQGTPPWDGFTVTEPYASSSITDALFYSNISISTDQGLLTFSSGTVTSVSANTPYLAWAAGINWNGGDSSPGADPDHDRVVNLMEYALGGNPVSALSAPRPLPQVSADNMLEITFLRAGPGLTYTVLGSSDLINWSEIPYTPVAVGGTQVVSDTVNLTDHPRRFLRLRVSAQ